MTTWIGFNTFQNSCKATKTSGFLRRNLALAPMHTKEVQCKTLVRTLVEYTAPIWHTYNETQLGQVEKVQRTAARWAGRRWTNPSGHLWREQSSLTFFYKIHSGTVCLEKDEVSDPASNLRRTRASHDSQYTIV